MKALDEKYDLILLGTSTSSRALTLVDNSKILVDQLQVLLPSNSRPPRNQMMCNMNIDGGAIGKIVPRLIKDLILKYHIGLLALLEIGINDVKVDKVIKNLGVDSWYKVDIQGFSRVIWIAWDSSLIKKDIIGSHPHCIHLDCSNIDGSNAFYTSMVYDSPNPAIREGLWHELYHFS
ncbi:hypothetical protein CR513_35462, partial [Mucuna pruriens]